MLNFRLIYLLAFIVIWSGINTVQASNLSGKTIVFCGDGSGWPPYTYETSDEPGVVKGYDVDVLSEILSAHDIKAEFVMPSWAQCLAGTAQGKRFQVALSASYSEERDKRYLLTKAYYSTVQSYFYSLSKFPQPPEVKLGWDLFTYGKVCGRYAYNYEGAGIFKNNQIVMSGKAILP